MGTRRGPGGIPSGFVEAANILRNSRTRPFPALRSRWLSRPGHGGATQTYGPPGPRRGWRILAELAVARRGGRRCTGRCPACAIVWCDAAPTSPRHFPRPFPAAPPGTSPQGYPPGRPSVPPKTPGGDGPSEQGQSCESYDTPARRSGHGLLAGVLRRQRHRPTDRAHHRRAGRCGPGGRGRAADGGGRTGGAPRLRHSVRPPRRSRPSAS